MQKIKFKLKEMCGQHGHSHGHRGPRGNYTDALNLSNITRASVATHEQRELSEACTVKVLYDVEA